MAVGFTQSERACRWQWASKSCSASVAISLDLGNSLGPGKRQIRMYLH